MSQFLTPEPQQASRESLLSAIALWLTAVAATFCVVWAFDTAVLSASLNFRFDLSLCAPGFASIVLGATFYSIAGGALLLGAIFRAFLLAYTEKHPPWPVCKALVGPMLVVAFLLVLPLVTGDGVWQDSQGRSGVTLEVACIWSHTDTPFAIWLPPVVCSILLLLALWWTLHISRAIRGDWLLELLARAAQARNERRQANASVRTSLKSLVLAHIKVGKWLVTALAAVMLALSGVALVKFTATKAYKQIAWNKVEAQVVGRVDKCAIRQRARSNRWIAISEKTCSEREQRRLKEELAARSDAILWQLEVTSRFSIRIEASGRSSTFEVDPYYVPSDTPIGAKIPMLADPARPGHYVRPFNEDETNRAMLRIIAVVVSGIVLYLLHVHRWNWPGGPNRPWWPPTLGRRSGQAASR